MSSNSVYSILKHFNTLDLCLCYFEIKCTVVDIGQHACMHACINTYVHMYINTNLLCMVSSKLHVPEIKGTNQIYQGISQHNEQFLPQK